MMTTYPNKKTKTTTPLSSLANPTRMPLTPSTTRPSTFCRRVRCAHLRKLPSVFTSATWCHPRFSPLTSIPSPRQCLLTYLPLTNSPVCWNILPWIANVSTLLTHWYSWLKPTQTPCLAHCYLSIPSKTPWTWSISIRMRKRKALWNSILTVTTTRTGRDGPH